MQLTLQAQLLPTPEQALALENTMRTFNQAADWLAGETFARKTTSKFILQKQYYTALRSQFGLSAQMAVRCIARVAQACQRDKNKRPHFRTFANPLQDVKRDSARWSTLRSLNGSLPRPKTLVAVLPLKTSKGSVNGTVSQGATGQEVQG